ncbi:flagellar hook-associated protein FlgK [Ornithinibacillus scapharcae]|uniref:flagellar hook-associated protein FlgK n=1 Tax=Ornithinibacillus scapharcae TaxID=1147159 RepID=UPI000225B14B|nr:flagellar hook-associated protein FlgK [Ornithinibacillus scapharcae]
MGASFSGIELMKRAIFSHQSAIRTTGHNIANANTDGYSRQRVNYVETNPINGMSRNRLELPGQIGSGVEVNVVERLRVHYTDFQFRTESSKYGYYHTKTEALTRMESIMNEPSKQGLSHTMESFWQSLQDLAVDPTSEAARSIVRQRGIAVADTFNHLHTSLTTVKRQLKGQLVEKVEKVNTLATQINELNMQIEKLEGNGYLPNDLYDERDGLVDKLSELVNIKVTAYKSGNAAMAIADGVYSIEIIGDNGYSIFGNTKLVDTDLKVANTLSVQDGIKGSVGSITLGSRTITGNDFTSMGEIQALIELQGYENANGEVEGTFPWMLAELDNMAFNYAAAFNEIHEAGNSTFENANAPMDIPFFADSVHDRISSYSRETADVVFVVDNSGSMGGKLATVADKLAEFVGELTKGDQLKNVNLGLVKYIENSQSIVFPDSQDIWTTDLAEFEQEIKNLEISGARENLMDALNGIIPVYGTNESFKHIIFVTDESDDSLLTSEDILDQFKERGIQIHGIFNPSFPYNLEDVEHIVQDTGGTSVDINATDWSEQLINIIGTNIREYVETAGQDGFEKEGYAGRIKVSDDVVNDISKIAAGKGTTNGDGQNALDLANVSEMDLPFSSEFSDFRTYFGNIIGQLGVMTQEAMRMEDNTSVLRHTVSENRQSISSVSLDEEFTNLIQFQHAFNAASRQITAMDEVLDRIINKM